MPHPVDNHRVADGRPLRQDVETLSTGQAVINSRQTYVQDTRPTDASAGDVWIRPYELPEPVGEPLFWYPMEEGVGTSLSDSRSQENGTINGPSWVTGDWAGKSALEGDGTDDYVELTNMGPLGTQLPGPLTVAFTFQTTDGSSALFAVNDAPQAFYVSIGTLSASNGQVQLYVRDSNNNNSVARTDSTFHDGNKHRAVISYSDASSAGNWTFAVDGNIESTTSSTGTLSGFSEFVNPLTLFAYNDNGSLTRYYGGKLDNIQFSFETWDSGDIAADYARQPWS